MNIRLANIKDQKDILEIYNESVLNSTATFDIKERSYEKQMDYYEKHQDRHSFIVYEKENEILGWAAISEWSEREAYKDAGELSIYVRKDQRGKGIGKKLFLETLKKAKEKDFHTLISIICSENELSIKMHEKEGFKLLGVMKEVGNKFDRFLDVVMMQKIL